MDKQCYGVVLTWANLGANLSVVSFFSFCVNFPANLFSYLRLLDFDNEE
jgi:hypothetical protein